MFRNLKAFNDEIKRWGKRVPPELAVKVHKKIAFDAFAGIVLKTPVGNPDLWKSKPPKGYVGGRARGNWQITVGAPAEGEVSGAETIGMSRGTKGAAFADAAAALTSLAPFQVIYISNNVPYILRLESGDHSTQAPQGMVAVTLEEIRSQLATARSP